MDVGKSHKANSPADDCKDEEGLKGPEDCRFVGDDNKEIEEEGQSHCHNCTNLEGTTSHTRTSLISKHDELYLSDIGDPLCCI